MQIHYQSPLRFRQQAASRFLELCKMTCFELEAYSFFNASEPDDLLK